MSVDWDVLVIGRSYAGLSAALNLGRARRSVLVVGSGGPRNQSVFHAHGLITQDGAAPGDIIAAAEKGLDKYPTVELVDDRVTALAVVDGGFRASIGKRTSTASTVIIATGANDNPPPIPGLAEHWGRGVFTCPYCDGFERSGTHLANVEERPIARVQGDGNTNVWAIGDVTSMRSNMSLAITDGVIAAVDLNTALHDRQWNETA